MSGLNKAVATAVGWLLFFIFRKVTDAELTVEVKVRCPGIEEDITFNWPRMSVMASVTSHSDLWQHLCKAISRGEVFSLLSWYLSPNSIFSSWL